MIKIVLNDEAYDDDIEADFLVYHYINEGYEGYGNALLYKDGNWYTHDLGHCSCYGPFEELYFKKPFDLLEDAIGNLRGADWSESFNEDIKEIYKEARKWSYETR